MQTIATRIAVMAALAASSCALSAAGQSGQATHDNVLLGIHFLHQRADCNTTKDRFQDATPSIWDYFRQMPEDVAHISYADFWHWWYEFERYKGDEKGLDQMDAIVDACLQHGMKVKIDLCWSTWWTNDKDWEHATKKESELSIGPVDVDDWIHLCDLLGRRYRGRVALWMLQGEANGLKDYWQGAPIEHVAKVYRQGYHAFKRVDPGTMISIAGATPSKPRQSLDEWVNYHAKAGKGCYDDIPMNLFADIKGADPYHGLHDYYLTIRKAIDDAGQHDAEVSSAESSFQWAENSYKVTGPPARWDPNQDRSQKGSLSEEGQAWRCNESLGTFFDLGGNKFVFWGTEYAPGCGWAWRWGLRKYQDWWGVWPDKYKVPGTNIVFGYDNPDGRKVDLRPGWTSPQTNPYHPIWQVYEFWSRATPPAAEAVRLPSELRDSGPQVWHLATYLRAQDRCVALVQSDVETPISLHIDLRKTGWPDGAKLTAQISNESIDYIKGTRQVNWRKSLPAEVSQSAVNIDVAEAAGFTTVMLVADHPALAAECLQQHLLGSAEVGKPIEAVVTLRNTGITAWSAKETLLASPAPELANWSAHLPNDVAAGETVAMIVQMPAPQTQGYVSHSLRLRRGDSQWFGPLVGLSAMVKDENAPCKLVAFREFGQVRLKWFAPQREENVASYEVYRADGFMKPFELLKTTKETDFVDEPPVKDSAYFYHVVAIDGKGNRSRPSNDDNAKALSKPRIWDAEVTQHSIPPRMQLGEERNVAVTLRNTGSKAWELARPKSEIRFLFSTMQLWGDQEEAHLPKIDLPDSGTVAPGQTVTLTIPFAAIRPGRSENHWILCMDVVGKQRVYFGTPLLVETAVAGE